MKISKVSYVPPIKIANVNGEKLIKIIKAIIIIPRMIFKTVILNLNTERLKIE